MSQTKSQLLNPLNGNINVTGVITSSSAVVGTSVTINNGGLNVTGVITATSFSGDGSGLTGVASTDNIITSTPAQFLDTVNVSGFTTLGAASASSLVVSGVTTLSNVVVGGATTELIVDGDARITGILTIGTSSITLDGSNNNVNVGTAVTIIGSTGTVQATTFVGTFVGDGSGLTGVGVGTEDNINTSGIVTASKIVAAEYEGSGDKLIFSPTVTSFSPTDGATDVSLDTNIVLTFNQPVYAGVGSIFLRNSSPDAGIGTEIEAIGISSSSITFNNQTLTINPVSLLPTATDVYVVLPQGVITNAVAGAALSLTTYNFTTLAFAVSSTNPSAGATNVGLDTSITLTFTSIPSRGTGTIELKKGDPLTGTSIESFDAAASGQISVSGNDWILTPSSPLGYASTIYPIIPAEAITNYVGLNTTGADSYSFETEGLPALGSSFEGGYLICASGGTGWIVAPSSAEVSRNWFSRNDANTRAQQVSGCTGWFVPSYTQLSNPGYTCRTYWDSYNTTCCYWSDTQSPSTGAWYLDFANGALSWFRPNSDTLCIRAFRCVSY